MSEKKRRKTIIEPYKEEKNIVTRKIIDFCEDPDNAAMIKDAYRLYKSSKKRKFLNKVYQYISEADFKKVIAQNPILILTANDVEIGVLHSWISNNKQSNTIISIYKKDIIYYIFKWYGYTIINVGLGTIGSHTKFGSAITIRKILQEFTPRLIISMGVGFGIDDNNQSLGDVLVSQSVWVYDKGVKVTQKDNWVYKYKQSYDIDPWLDDCFRQRRDFLDSKKKKYSIQYGNILTGEMVVDDESFKQKIIRSIGEVFIGGEMEGYGLFFECEQADIPCVIIKGICDWGVEKNALDKDPKKNNKIKDSLQAYAMVNTLDACDTLFEDEFLFTGRKQNNFKDWMKPPLVERSKFAKFFYQNSFLYYFIINLIWCLATLYTILIHTDFSFPIASFTVALGTITICLLIFMRLLSSNMKILKDIFSVINNIIKKMNDSK